MDADLKAFHAENAFTYDLSPIPGLEECKGVLPEPPRAAVEGYQRFNREQAKATLGDLQGKPPEEYTPQDILRAVGSMDEKQLAKNRKESFEISVALCSGSFPGTRPISREELEKLYEYPFSWDFVQGELIQHFLAGPLARRSDSKPSLEMLPGGKRSAS